MQASRRVFFAEDGEDVEFGQLDCTVLGCHCGIVDEQGKVKDGQCSFRRKRGFSGRSYWVEVSKLHLHSGRGASRIRKEENCVPAYTSRWDVLIDRVW